MSQFSWPFLQLSNNLFPLISSILREPSNFHFCINIFHRQHCCDNYHRNPNFYWQRQGKKRNCKCHVWKFWAIYAICLEQTRETLGIQWKYLITLHVVSLERANHLHFHRKMWLENGHVIKWICIYSYPECMYVWWDLYHQFIWGTLTWIFSWPSVLLIILYNFSWFSS